MPLAKIHLSPGADFDTTVELAHGPDGKDAFKVEIVHTVADQPMVRVHLYVDREIGGPDVPIVEIPYADVEFSGLIQSLPHVSPWEELHRKVRAEEFAELKQRKATA